MKFSEFIHRSDGIGVLCPTMRDEIVPDERDWTWVLSRQCHDCGFDASVAAGGDVAALMRADAASWAELGSRDEIKAGRTRADRWSSLEYAAHVRDVYRLADERLGLMVEQDDPLFANWDQDQAAIEQRYDTQDPGTVMAELAVAAEIAAARLDAVTAAQWHRPGRRSDGSRFTIDTFARYVIHDPIHHIWDLTGRRHRQ